MIEMNDLELIRVCKDIGLAPRQIRKILRSLAGIRVYFRKKPTEYEEIKSLYEQMIAVGTSRSEAVKELSRIFEKSESRIREITAIQKGLFDEF